MRQQKPRLALVLSLLWAVLGPLPASAQLDPSELLPVERAFALTARTVGQNIEVSWRVADGYYLYRHALGFDAIGDGLVLGPADIPPGEQAVDEFFGDIETYRNDLVVVVPVVNWPASGPAQLTVRFQGCADVGVCYPPERQPVTVEPPRPQSEPALENSLRALFGASAEDLAGGALPEEQAFRFEAIALDGGRLLARFTAAPGYYLYQEKFRFRVLGDDEITVARVDFPTAQPMVDEYFGATQVYFDQVEIPIALARPAGGARQVQLQADFQGCLNEGICYPPMSRQLIVTLPAAGEALAGPDSAPATAVSEPDRLAQALAGTPLAALALFLLAGVLLAFTPCVFPMVPILSGLIAGEGEAMNSRRALRLSLVYVLAMALVYTAFGVIAGLFGQNLQAWFQQPWVLISFAALFVVLALSMFGFYELQLPAWLQSRFNRWANRAEGGTLAGAAVMGALSALVVGPCVAPALMGALVYIGQSGDAVLGGAALFAMAIGMGIPLIVWGTSAGSLLPRAGAWMSSVKAVFGVGLLALAIWMLERVLAGDWIMLLWGVLAIVCGVFLGALTRLPSAASGWLKLWQGVGVVLLVFGSVQLIGAWSGGSDWTRPLGHWRHVGEAGGNAALRFARVDNLQQLRQALAAAPGPTLLDFYADWCVDCVRMDRRTFRDPQVIDRLQEMTLLKVDLTDYNDAHRSLLAEFGLIGPPAYLFFNADQERPELRSFGFLTADELLQRMDRLDD